MAGHSGYLKWLAGHEAAGARFEDGEVDRQVHLGPVTLRGRLDRIDRLADGRALVLDRDRAAGADEAAHQGRHRGHPAAFLCRAMLEDDTLAAAYLNLGEREPAKAFAQEHVVVLRDELVHGILDDMAQIAAGAPLPALGEGQACTWCEARGLCRRDFWSP